MNREILVADDPPNSVISLQYPMKHEGYNALVARDGQEALEATTIAMFTAKGLAMGADTCLTKPFSAGGLLQEVWDMTGAKP